MKFAVILLSRSKFRYSSVVTPRSIIKLFAFYFPFYMIINGERWNIEAFMIEI